MWFRKKKIVERAWVVAEMYFSEGHSRNMDDNLAKSINGLCEALKRSNYRRWCAVIDRSMARFRLFGASR